MSTTPTLETLTTLAQWMGLTPADAVALPCVVEVAARKSGRSQSFIVQTCWTCEELRTYLAGCCRTAIAGMSEAPAATVRT